MNEAIGPLRELARSRSEKGIALVAVIWVTALLATIAASLAFESRTESRLTYNMVENAVARAAADAGVYRAIFDLLGTRPGQKLGEAKFRPDGTVYEWPFGKSKVYISVQDESAKVNLNQAPDGLLIALFQSANISQENAAVLADAIADYRDPDSMTRTQGAELSDYEDAGLPWGPKNAPFEAVEELRQVLGMTPDLYNRVAPFLTVYSFGSAINASMAGDQLTDALRQAGFESFVDSPGAAFSIRAEARNDSGAVFVRGAVVQLVPEVNDPVRFLVWRQGR